MIRRQKKSPFWVAADRMAFIAVLTLAVLCLSGCGTQVVYVPQYVLETPPDALLIDCEIEPPPAPGHYLSLTYKEKEGELTDVLTKNYGFQESCNVKNGKVRKWKVDQIELVGRKNKEAREKAGEK